MSAPVTNFLVLKKYELDEGQRLLDRGEPQMAAGVLDAGLKERPKDRLLLLYSGLAHVEIGEDDIGLDRIREALKMAPDRPLLRLFFARALYDSGRFDECLKECAHVASSQSGHPGAAVLSLLCLAHNDRMAGLERLSLDGLSDDLHLQGRALFLAEETLQESERPQPKPAWPTASMPWERSNVGRVAGGPPKARGSRDQHRSADSSMERMKPGEWIRRCRMAQGGGLIDRAVVYAEAAMQSGGDDEVRVVLATLYLETERYREVEACLRGFMENDPERNTYVGISRFYRGDFPGATAALHKAEPDSARAAHTLGRAYLAQGKSKEGRCAFVRTALLDGSIPVERVARAYLNGRA